MYPSLPFVLVQSSMYISVYVMDSNLKTSFTSFSFALSVPLQVSIYIHVYVQTDRRTGGQSVGHADRQIDRVTAVQTLSSLTWLMAWILDAHGVRMQWHLQPEKRNSTIRREEKKDTEYSNEIFPEGTMRHCQQSFL